MADHPMSPPIVGKIKRPLKNGTERAVEDFLKYRETTINQMWGTSEKRGSVSCLRLIPGIRHWIDDPLWRQFEAMLEDPASGIRTQAQLMANPADPPAIERQPIRFPSGIMVTWQDVNHKRATVVRNQNVDRPDELPANTPQAPWTMNMEVDFWREIRILDYLGRIIRGTAPVPPAKVVERIEASTLIGSTFLEEYPAARLRTIDFKAQYTQESERHQFDATLVETETVETGGGEQGAS